MSQERIELDTGVPSPLEGASHPALCIECAYQPIVDLHTNVAVGYEALARWPESSGLAPDTAFRSARRLGYLDELDRAAQLAALRGARCGGLPPTHTLFINVEADTSSNLSLADTITAATTDPAVHNIVVELTERTLLVDPARVIEITDTARSLGVGVALDDVGSNPDSLTMLEFVAPDVIKLDANLIHSRSLSPSQATTLDTVTSSSNPRPTPSSSLRESRTPTISRRPRLSGRRMDRAGCWVDPHHSRVASTTSGRTPVDSSLDLRPPWNTRPHPHRSWRTSRRRSRAKGC